MKFLRAINLSLLLSSIFLLISCGGSSSGDQQQEQGALSIALEQGIHDIEFSSDFDGSIETLELTTSSFEIRENNTYTSKNYEVVDSQLQIEEVEQELLITKNGFEERQLEEYECAFDESNTSIIVDCEFVIAEFQISTSSIAGESAWDFFSVDFDFDLEDVPVSTRAFLEGLEFPEGSQKYLISNEVDFSLYYFVLCNGYDDNTTNFDCVDVDRFPKSDDMASFNNIVVPGSIDSYLTVDSSLEGLFMDESLQDYIIDVSLIAYEATAIIFETGEVLYQHPNLNTVVQSTWDLESAFNSNVEVLRLNYLEFQELVYQSFEIDQDLEGVGYFFVEYNGQLVWGVDFNSVITEEPEDDSSINTVAYDFMISAFLQEGLDGTILNDFSNE